MSKEDAIKKIKEILAKNKSFNCVEVKINFKNKERQNNDIKIKNNK